LYHTTEMLETMARTAPALLGWTTVCAIEQPGTDTTSTVDGWLRRFDGVQIAARVDPDQFAKEHAGRLFAILPSHLVDVPSFARMVASLLLPGGVLVQDVHLSTLHCIPSDRWWDSIYVAATVRGMFPKRQPAVRFVSNKRGYTATFGRDLMNAGFDPRDVMDKVELERVILPSIARDIDERFPLELTASAGAITTASVSPVPIPITEETHDAALRLAGQHGFHVYDALIVAAALEGDCTTLYSEDLESGQVIDGRLTIHNPFST